MVGGPPGRKLKEPGKFEGIVHIQAGTSLHIRKGHGEGRGDKTLPVNIPRKTDNTPLAELLISSLDCASFCPTVGENTLKQVEPLKTPQNPQPNTLEAI